MKPKNIKIKNDLCEYYSPAKAATTSVAVTTAEASCMLLQIEKFPFKNSKMPMSLQ